MSTIERQYAYMMKPVWVKGEWSEGWEWSEGAGVEWREWSEGQEWSEGGRGVRGGSGVRRREWSEGAGIE